MNLVASGYSVKGRGRPSSSENEEAILVDEVRGLFMVADGAGGFPHAQTVANVVIDTLRLMGCMESSKDALAAAFASAQNALLAYCGEVTSQRAPRVTVAAVWLREASDGWHEGFVAHAGNVSVIVVDHTDKTITYVTNPHTAPDGQDRPEVPTRFIGNCAEQPHLAPLRVRPDSTVLVVSDGVTWRLHSDDILIHTLMQIGPQPLTVGLVRNAVLREETGDISVIAIRTLRR